MPRIALFTSTFPEIENDSTAEYAGHLTQSLAQQGHEIHVVTSSLPEIKPAFKKVTVHKIISRWTLLEVHKVLRFFLEIKPDLIHILYPTPLSNGPTKQLLSFVPEIAKTMGRMPSVLTLLEDDYSLAQKVQIGMLCSQSDVVTVPQLSFKSNLQKLLPFAEKKIRVLNTSVEPAGEIARSLEARIVWGFAEKDSVLAIPSPFKRTLDHLFEVLLPLMKRNSNLKVLALGDWDSPQYRVKTVSQLTQAKVIEQFIVTGHLSTEQRKLALDSADFLVGLDSRPLDDFFPDYLKKSLVSGLPTMTWAKERSYSEFDLKHGQNIWITPFENYKALRSDLELMISSSSLRKELSHGGKTLRSGFGFDFSSNELSRIYSQLLSSAFQENFA